MGTNTTSIITTSDCCFVATIKLTRVKPGKWARENLGCSHQDTNIAGQHPTDLPSLRGSNNTPPNNAVFTNQFRSLFPKLTITDPEEAKELAQTASMGLPNKERVPEYRLDDQPNSQAPIPITVTDPKNVKWLRRAKSSGVDPDQVISTFRQMQQLNLSLIHI